MRVLIVYGTTEGQTRKISERIGERIRELGHDAALQDSASLPADLDVGAYDAVIAAASVHQHRFQASLAHFVKEHLEQLQAKPQGYVDQFLVETRWHPTRTELVAGALVYTRYDFFKRQIMKLIVRKGGGPTDASQDYEFTDWDALSRFVDSFIETANS
jgi:menaquinone-dependent protoporphyrinogen oxidase